MPRVSNFSGGGEIGIFVFSFLLLCLTQVVFLTIIRKQAASLGRRSWPYELVFFLLVLSSPAYISWMTITLMDTCLWGAMVASLLYLAVHPPLSTRGRVLATSLVAIAPMARPEALLFAPLTVALVWVRNRANACSNHQWFPAILFSAFVLSSVILTAFRLAYFGHPFPNTYYAKVSPSLVYNLFSGAKYAAKFLSESALVSGLVLVLAFSVVHAFVLSLSVRKDTDPHILGQLWGILADPEHATSVVALTLFVIPILTGGDHFALYRFYQPFYPVLCLFVVLLLMKASSRELAALQTHPASRAITSFTCLIWLFSCAFRTSWVTLKLQGSPIQHEFGIATNGRRVGQELNRLLKGLPNWPSIGVIVAGGVAREYRGRIVDLMGLNNTFIAHFPGERKGIKNHAAFEKNAFWAIEPDILLVSPPPAGQSTSFTSQVLKGLLFDPRFVATWRYGVLTSRNDPTKGFEAFYSDAFLRRTINGRNYDFVDTRVWTGKEWAVECREETPENGG